MLRKGDRQGSRGVEKGEQENRGGVCRRSCYARNGRRVLCARQNATSAPLKHDLLRNEYDCQISLISSFLNKRDGCRWFILTKRRFGGGALFLLGHHMGSKHPDW